MRRTGKLVAKRIQQTPMTFRNPLSVFAQVATASTPLGRRDLQFRLRSGYDIVTPNVPGARFPVYEIFADDAYDLDTLLAGLPPAASVLDVGGQVGSFTLAVARAMPEARIHTYEASPFTAGYLQRNVSANGLDGRVVVHAVAMSDREGTFTFVDGQNASGHNGLTAPEGSGVETTVPSTTFDAAVATAGGAVQLVKMDVEGAEYDIILTSSPASWSSVERVVMEYHPVSGRSLDELLSFFEGVGLRPSRHDRGTRPGLGNIWLARD